MVRRVDPYSGAVLRASVIVAARDAAATLPRTLAALARQELAGGFESIVVDDGSLDDTAAIAERSEATTHVVRRGQSEGAGAARNAGAALARGSVLVFLDADCFPAPDWLARGVAATSDHDLVQGMTLPDPLVELGPFDRTLSVVDAHGLFESANLFVTRELFQRLGGFSTGLERGTWRRGRGGDPFGEDVIFGWRARRAGARTGFCEQAVAYHEVFARGPRQFIAERTRLALFPALAVQVPELRNVFFYHRLFHSRRSASFDLAAAGLVLALATRRVLPLTAALPYVRLLAGSARRWGGRGAARVALVEAIADGVGALALVRGSVGSGSLLL
jgi:glycosyltransferase involved in cell wall biosynthesis